MVHLYFKLCFSLFLNCFSPSEFFHVAKNLINSLGYTAKKDFSGGHVKYLLSFHVAKNKIGKGKLCKDVG